MELPIYAMWEMKTKNIASKAWVMESKHIEIF